MRGVDRGGPFHHWHVDGACSLDKLNHKRIKVMLYLDPVKAESGALRVIPAPINHRSTMRTVHSRRRMRRRIRPSSVWTVLTCPLMS